METDAYWRAAEELLGADLSHARYDFIRPHIRVVGERVEMRFIWMSKEIPS